MLGDTVAGLLQGAEPISGVVAGKVDLLRLLQPFTGDDAGEGGGAQRGRRASAETSFAFLHREGLLDRVAHGVYRIRAAGEPDHLALRAAWLQLDPARPAWARLEDPDVALVSHASAASLYGVGGLRADVHEFTLPRRRQTSQPDVRLHRGTVPDKYRIILRGLPATRAGWMVRDLLADHVDPTQVAQITAEIIDHVYDYPSAVAEAIAPYAARFGLARGDGMALLDHLLTAAGGGSRSSSRGGSASPGARPRPPR